MFDFLKGTKTELTLTPDRADGVYFPGETIAISVKIQPDKDLKLQGGQLNLTGTERYNIYSKESHYDSTHHRQETRNVHVWEESDFFGRTENFLGETTLPANAPQRYDFKFNLPTNALPSCRGEILQINWQAKVKLDRPLAADLNVVAELQVRSLAPSQVSQPVEYGGYCESGDANMYFLLPGLKTVIGEKITGDLRILPLKNFDADEVRLELVYLEDVPEDMGNQHNTAFPFTLAGNTKFIAGQQQTIPIQASLPPYAPPTIQTPHGSVSWKMKAILARPLHPDACIEKGFLVYSAKALE
jgi:hypothetical protein